MKTVVLVVTLALIATGCGGGGGSGGGSGNGRDPDQKGLRVTEIGLNPTAGGTWVEIHNPESERVELAGLKIASFVGETLFERVKIGSGEPKLEPGEHRAFTIALPATAARVEIYTKLGKPIHVVGWPALSPSAVGDLAGTSWGVTSHGTWRVLDPTTPGAGNVDPPSPVLLNEVCADNDDALENPDAPGEHDDWIEIHNPGATALDLAGMTLTDDAGDPGRWTLPAGSVVPAGGHLVVHADDRGLGGPHASFRLPAENGVLCLYGPDGRLVDVYAWDQMGEDRSRGRDTDGAADWVAFRELTPGSSNAEGLRDATDDPAHRKRSPDYDRVFDPTTVKELRIEIAPGVFADMVRQRDEAIEENIADPDFEYVECTVRFEGDVWHHVGVRFKGASSAVYPWRHGFEKYPLKLDFDEFEDDWPEYENQRFWGMKKLSLGNGIADPTYLREHLCLEAMRDAGVVASRWAPIAVFVDTGVGPRYWGIYASVEQVDGTFLKDRFGDDEGNLYKPEGPGAALDRFVESSMVKKSNEDEADYTDVQELIAVLNTDYADTASQKAAIEAVFEVDGFLRWLAVSSAMSHFDTYATREHNYYLYRHHDDGRFRFITWDHNLAFGSPAGNFQAEDAAEWNILDPREGKRPLIQRVLEVPEWNNRYLDLVRAFRDGWFSKASFDARVAAYHDLLKPYVTGPFGENPPYTVLNDLHHFERGLTRTLSPVGAYPIPGLLEFADERRAYLHEVLN